jgi:hypothetical protein
LDESDVLKRRAQGGREEQDVSGTVGNRHLGVLIPAAGHAAPLQAQAWRRASRHRIALDIPGQEQMAGIEDRQENASGKRPEVDDPRVGPAGGLIDEILARRRVSRLLEHASSRARELRQPLGDEPALERWDEGDPDDGQRAEHDNAQREAQPRSDTPQRIHPRNR